MSLRLRCQQGFTTVTLMGVLLVGGLMVTAGFAAVDPDTKLSKKDQDYKQSYAAAEAGLNYYLYHLGQDNNFYLKCDNVPPPNGSEQNPINLAWTAGADTRRWRRVPGETAEYTIELLPAKGHAKCLENKQETMVDPLTGTFRVRATGRVKFGTGSEDRRSVIATLRRKSFIDFLYFTDFETADPATYSTPALQAWASNNCVRYRAARDPSCTNIQFADSDAINGPFHTNDDILTCGVPDFGRTANDAIELNGKTPGWKGVCGASTPNFKGKLVWPGGQLTMPPSNNELASVADPAYSYKGETTITLSGANMTVTNAQLSPTTKTLPLPTNGVIWVDSTGCPSGNYARKQKYVAAPTCGNLTISGNYSKDLTIGAANDIIVRDDITRNNSGLLLGLVAQNFVRVYHKVNWDASNNCTSNASGNPNTIDIQAAILALQHSFIVDNWSCGSPLGTLTVDGAIAQSFRGPVGTLSGGVINHGYSKNYIYNDNLRFREPPYFLDPVQSSWRIARQNEQVPAK